MKKSDREKVFNKYGGKCAYCGCELAKGWHVDEIEPVRRRQKTVGNSYYHKITGEKLVGDAPNAETFFEEYEWKSIRRVANGCEHPENYRIENQNPACPSCNINKHSMPLENFRELIQGFMKHLNEINTQYKIAKRYGLVSENPKPVVFYFEQF